MKKLIPLVLLTLCIGSQSFAATYQCGPYALNVDLSNFNRPLVSLNSASLKLQCNDLQVSSQAGYYSSFKGDCLKDGVDKPVGIEFTNTLLIGAYGADCGTLSVTFLSDQEENEYTCS